MPAKLTSRDYRIIGIVIVVAAASLAISVKYFWRAFPEASIEFKVTREQSARLADKFLNERGLKTDAYRHASIFDYDEIGKLYLERTLGLERLNELARAGGRIRIWRWSHRWFKPLDKEELRVQITPAGEVAGFSHELPETAPGANLDGAAARPIAEQFLSTLGRNLGELDFLEATEEKRPARTDHVLTWTDKTVNLGDGSQRIAVSISGDQVTGYREYIHVPEEWTRQYQQLRSRNDSAQRVDEVLWILLSIAMAVMLVRRVRMRDVPVRLSLALGAIAVVLVFLDDLNTFSVAQFGYSTADTYTGFIARYLLGGLLSAFGAGVGIFLIVAASEPIYRESFPALPSIGRSLTWKGLRSRSFFMANVVGIGLTFFFFAYQTVFYLAANRLGAWAPSDVPFSDELNTAIPWVAVLFGGFAPAILEEMQFRVFAIPFLKRLLRFWPLAIVVAAFNWGFLHSAYPNEPFFIRGVEVGIGGIIIGVIMLRFGVIATMIWHYSVDALYTAFILLRSSNLYLQISGGLAGGIMLIPLAIALFMYLKKGGFSDDAEISNAAVGTPTPAELQTAETPHISETAAPSYVAFSTKRIALAACLIVVLAALALTPVYRFGEGVAIGVTRNRARQIAGESLTKRGISGNYRSVAWLNENVDPLAVKYLFEHVSVREADRVYRQATRLLLWNVRYFRPLEKEEHWVFVDASTGEVFGYRHVLDEDAPGASLMPDAARTLAEKSVAEHGYSLSDFELETSQAEKRKAREDYTFIWQAKPGDPRNVADARYRIEVQVAGDEVVSFSRSFKLPEAWLRERESSGFANAVLTGLLVILIGGISAGFVIVFVRAIRAGRIPWSASGKVAIAAGVAAGVDALSQWATVDRGYSTSIPLSTFHLGESIGVFVSSLAAGLLVFVLVSLCAALLPRVRDVANPLARYGWRRDAIVAIGITVAAIAAIDRWEALLTNWFHSVAPADVEIIPALFDAYAPGVTIFLRSIVTAIASSAALGIFIYIARAGSRRRAWWFWVGAALLVVSLGPPNTRSVPEYLVAWGIRFFPAALILSVIVVFFRNNISAYLIGALCMVVAGPIAGLFHQPSEFYRWNGAVLGFLAAATVLWLLSLRRSSA